MQNMQERLLLASRGSRLCSDLNYVAPAASECAGDQWQRNTHCHDHGDDVQRRLIIYACNQYGADDAACTPGGEHGTINRPSIPRSEEVSRKGWHGAKATSIAQS